MAIELNHLIVGAADPHATAVWVAELLGLGAPEPFGSFWQVTAANGVTLDFDADDGPPRPAHLAFLVSEEEFDAAFERLTSWGVEHYADPAGRQRGEINRRDGGRGTYFASPDGHWLEIITRPYGGG
jgi:hypothetical protein